MSAFDVNPLPDATFGGLFATGGDAAELTEAAEADPQSLVRVLDAHQGLLLIKGMGRITEEPELLLRLSRLFGTEVESYHETRMARQNVHPEIPEIFMVSNIPPADKVPPPPPEPLLNAVGSLPTRFPHRRGWHTDQSYRRPPPDVSLFYCVVAAPKGQAQTLYADGIGAYEALSADMKTRVANLVGIHAKPGVGRGEVAVRAGAAPMDLGPGDLPQRQPVVRVHPETGAKSLYLCEAGQMDWIDGPFVGMETGPDGAGAKLLYELMSHFTRDDFVFAHEWDEGDLVIYDNRTLIHAATWFDAEKHQRLMWRTTVSGNPGAEYAGEAKSWLAA
ncbi:MAG: TauD/TfdA family dioxygenase [Alphaproteobacteria bacterium]|nr:TauD/TfdA family dioxygenase [Alphaproteobacteria bacterium]